VKIRCGRGLGDSIYLRSIADHFAKEGPVTVLSGYPDVFIGSGATVAPFTRAVPCVAVHYTHRMDVAETQWQSVKKTARAPADLPLSFAWAVRNSDLVRSIRQSANGRPIIVVHGGRMPMQRGDGWASDMMPKREAFLAALEGLSDCYTVRVGNDPNAYPLPVDCDMNGGTSVSDLIDIFHACDAVIAQCSFAVPLAEAFGKPLLAIWSAKGLVSREPHLRKVTPKKVLTERAGSRYVIDDQPDDEIESAAAMMTIRSAPLEFACAS
jgi:hypothetical protein